MNKNKKIIFATLGVLIFLIGGLLLIRNPGVQKPIPEPIQQEETVPTIVQDDKELDDSHQKVIAIVNDVADAAADEAPGIWNSVVDAWKWFEAFPSRYAIILLGVAVFLIGIMVNNKSHQSQGSSKRR
ncbi:hypothetical protein [Paenibacillus sp. MMO-177]|uniref:hypothetical protein n=1 Tax=Paenibacillus sp. MMO-177 TaxID=3081289 RepID=UPI0030179100